MFNQIKGLLQFLPPLKWWVSLQLCYEVQKKILGLFWWNFNNIDAVETGIYDTLEKAKRAIEIDKGTIKKTIINVE